MKTYNTIACGGTFDLLHSGHKYFLDQILGISENVILGLTSDVYIRQHKADRGVASYEERKEALVDFLKNRNALTRVKIIPIDDVYGPLLEKDLEVEAIAVTNESNNAAELINKKRTELALPRLSVEVMSQLKDAQDKIISATRVRTGEIDRSGKNLRLPASLRYALQTAWGEILEHTPVIEDSSMVVTVGDITTLKFIQQEVTPLLCIIDNVVERVAVASPIIFNDTQRIYHLDNPAGTINKKIFTILEDVFNSSTKSVIEVNGEEDLLVLPVLLKAPMGTHVYYGQPHVGLVRIIVSDDVKRKAEALLEEFDTEQSI